jgi:sugar phosphate isomerase/epimerase
MSQIRFSRRRWLATSAAGLAAGLTGSTRGLAAGEDTPQWPAPFRFCLNTGTIRGQKLGIVKEVEVAAEAGYDAIEPWVGDISAYERDGGSLDDLRKRIADLGLTVEGGIAFAQWIVDDEARRRKGLEQARREMETVKAIGGVRIAAPPAGANREPGLDLLEAAKRYRALLEIGEEVGIVPALEIWGPSANLHRLGEAAFVAIESGHPKACLLPDVYHIYKGGSDFNGLKLLSYEMIPVLHMNDYPADPPRETISDRDRIMPGDGIAPLTQILRDLRTNGGGQVLSLELFNPTYYEMDPLKVAKLGLEKMKAAVEKAT